LDEVTGRFIHMSVRSGQWAADCSQAFLFVILRTANCPLPASHFLLQKSIASRAEELQPLKYPLRSVQVQQGHSSSAC
jgi:hypothetical protein